MKRRKCALVALVMPALLTLTFACSGQTDDTPQTLRVGRAYDIATLDPALLPSSGDAEIARQLFSGLTRYKPGTTKIEGDAATKWVSNRDGTSWTFQLRKGIKFQGGYGELTSKDVVASHQRIIDPKVASPWASTLSALKGVEAEGPYEVRLSLSAPDAALLGKLASPFTSIVSAEALRERGKSFGLEPIGSGPYQFESYESGQRLVFAAFDDYWEGKPSLPRIEYIPIPDASTLYSAFDSGDVDMIQVTDPDRYQRYKSQEETEISEVPLLQVRFLQFGVDKRPFNDPAVREAFSHAIDRKALVDDLFQGTSLIADSLLPLGVKYRQEDAVDYSYDPERARTLLAEAGYPEGLDVVLTVPENPRFKPLAVVVQQQLKDANINAKIQLMEPQAMLAKAATGTGLILWTQSLGYSPDPDLSLVRWYSSSGIPASNTGHISNPQLDSLLKSATSTVDEDVRTQDFRRAQRVIVENNYTYLIDYEQYIWARRAGLDESLLISPLRTLDVNPELVSGEAG